MIGRESGFSCADIDSRSEQKARQQAQHRTHPEVAQRAQPSQNTSASAIPVSPNAMGSHEESSGTCRWIGPHMTVRVVSKRVCAAKNNARLAITPTTAAVMPVNAEVRCWLCRNRSTYGAPRKTNKKQGTKVTHTTNKEARTAATHGSSAPGLR
jgi:hypothetical protein